LESAPVSPEKLKISGRDHIFKNSGLRWFLIFCSGGFFLCLLVNKSVKKTAFKLTDSRFAVFLAPQ